MTNGTRSGWGVRFTPRPLFTPGKDPVSIVQEAGWVPGPVWTDAEKLASTGIRSPDRPTRSQSLHRLSYSAHSILGAAIIYKNYDMIFWIGYFIAAIQMLHRDAKEFSRITYHFLGAQQRTHWIVFFSLFHRAFSYNLFNKPSYALLL
jgi:hypothetical protein